jgi:hypothetical protein
LLGREKANPEGWERNPFELIREGDKLFGRGTTDCLGHCCAVTMLMAKLGELKPKLERTIVALFIAGEEGAESGVGVDMVVEAGKIDELKNGESVVAAPFFTCFVFPLCDNSALLLFCLHICKCLPPALPVCLLACMDAHNKRSLTIKPRVWRHTPL